jgi:hypothetical protein
LSSDVIDARLAALADAWRAEIARRVDAGVTVA